MLWIVERACVRAYGVHWIRNETTQECACAHTLNYRRLGIDRVSLTLTLSLLLLLFGYTWILFYVNSNIFRVWFHRFVCVVYSPAPSLSIHHIHFYFDYDCNFTFQVAVMGIFLVNFNGFVICFNFFQCDFVCGCRVSLLLQHELVRQQCAETLWATWINRRGIRYKCIGYFFVICIHPK